MGECIPNRSCNYFVGSCRPTHPSHPMISSTTSGLEIWAFIISVAKQLLTNLTCLHIAILQTINWVKAYHNLVLNGTGPLKLLHLYGNFAIVVTTSNKLVAEPIHMYIYLNHFS